MVKIKLKDNIFYPELTDVDFQKKIYKKKEFYDNKILKETRKMKEICKPSDFKLFPQQKFLKNFISIDTPYNGILIFHGVGVGKTCAAISIAENFKTYVKKHKKKILILSSKSLIGNFRKTIYDLDKESIKKKKDDIVQCTGNEYMLKEEDRYLTRDQKIRKVKKNISNFYQFMGYGRFANDVKRKTGWNGTKKYLTDDIKQIIKREYSNRVLIIDEIHNVKKKKDGKSKEHERHVANILTEVVKNSDNLKLVLMSATPMYDKPGEIIFILNLLLLNDNRKPLERSKVFDKNGILKEDGYKLLEKYSTGYVSYLRGENPHTYPITIYPRESEIPKFKFDINGNKILPLDEIEYTKTIYCHMSKKQYGFYTKINSERKKNLSNKSNNKLFNSGVFQKLIQISNIIYPLKNKSYTEGKRGFTDTDNGNGAFYNCKKTSKTLQLSYQKHVIFNKGKRDEKPFLDVKYLNDYSPKIAKIIEYIKKSKGPILIYSRLIYGGILPLALALEQNGIQRYTTHGEQPLLNYPFNKKGGGGISEPVSYNGIPLSKYKNIEKFKPLKYAIVFPNQEYIKNTPYRLSEIISKKSNMNGSELKVILGTRVISEGIDFKFMRQIHIIDPWYNLSINEQIVGRGIRSCSHVDLPPEERNVEIFQYVAVPPKNVSNKEKKTETVDVKNYRLSETKDKRIKKVERILKKNAIDCPLNKEVNNININKSIKIHTASGEYRTIKFGFQPYTRECDYDKECYYKCNSQVKNKIIPDSSTYTLNYAKEDILRAKILVKEMYRYNYAYNINQIREKINNKVAKLQDLYIYIALDELLNNHDEIVYDKFSREGYLIYRGDYYIFQPKVIRYEKIPMYYRETPLKYKTYSINITDYVKSKTLLENKVNKNKKDNVFTIIKKEVEYILKTYYIFLNKNIPSKYQMNIIILYILDRFKNKQILTILRNILEDKDFVYKKDIKKIFNKLIYKKNNIQAIYLDPNYYCLDKKKIRKCKLDEKKVIIKDISKKDKNKNILYGIVENKNLKIIDKRKYTGARTLTKRKSKRSEITGRICSTYNIDDLIEILKYLNIKGLSNKKKSSLCFYIEILLRYNNYKKDKTYIYSKLM